jgi:hypothetical protein
MKKYSHVFPDGDVLTFDFEESSLNSDQSAGYAHLMAKWRSIFHQVNYLVLLDCGFVTKSASPSLNWGLHPLEAEFLEANGEYLFAMLKLIIYGFDFIKEKAEMSGRYFPFSIPLKLWLHICELTIESEYQDIISTGIDNGISLTEFRDSNKNLRDAYIGKLKEEQEEKMVLEFREGSWLVFWLYGIWDRRHRDPLKAHSDRYLKSLKRIISLSKKPEMISVIWNSGHPVESRRKQKVSFLNNSLR